MKPVRIATVAAVALLVAGGCGRQPSGELQRASDAHSPPTHLSRTSRSVELPAKQSIDLGTGIRLDLVLVPAGFFVMGDAAGHDDEKPVRQVNISRPFYLGKFEVTVEQFRRFVEATDYVTDAEKGTGFAGAFGWDAEAMEFKMNEDYSWRNPGFPQSDTDPVVNVSWHDAVEFCNWLSRQEGMTFRLPTEAEWEYACRAGTATSYSHGDDPEESIMVANVADADFQAQFPELEGVIEASDGHTYTSPAGSFAPNAFGLYDMHGNVWEWCADWYSPDYYAKAPRRDPSGPTTGEERVYRGGGWFNCARGCRAASRSAGQPENRNLTVGFRVAATPE